jgi:hypothetical protein
MANSTVNVYGTSRASAETANATQNQEVEMAFNNRGDLLTAQGLPFKSELVRMNNMWTARIATGSAFTYVNAWPTTRAELILYNGEAVGGKSLVIDSAWMCGITSIAAAQPISLLAQIGVVATVPTHDTAQLTCSRRGGKSYGGMARVAVANTTGGCLTNLWELLVSTNAPMTTNLGQGVYADLWGGWIVPPGYVFGLAGLSGTAAGTAIIGVTWAEVQLTYGS